MKATGIVLIGAAVIVVVLAALWPRTIELGLGAQGDCGPSILRLAAQEQRTSEIEQNAIDRCERQAFWTIVIGGLIGLVSFTVGLSLVLNSDTPHRQQAPASLSQRPQSRLPPPPPPPNPQA